MLKARIINNHVFHSEKIGAELDIKRCRPTHPSYYNGTKYSITIRQTVGEPWDFAFEDLEIIEVNGIKIDPLPMTHPIFNKFLTTPKEV